MVCSFDDFRLGLESLLDTMAHERAEKQAKQHGDAAAASTDTAILGPFYRENAPKYKHGDDIVQDHNVKDSEGNTGRTCYLHGKVTDIHGKPVEGAEIDVWHTAANGECFLDCWRLISLPLLL
jgi:catechol 1,2-dioxygenase